VEFKSFVSEKIPGEYAHLFEPLNEIDESVVRGNQVRQEAVTAKLDNWEKISAWANQSERELIATLTMEMPNKYPDLISKPLGKYYAFYRGKTGSSTRSLALIINKGNLSVRIRADSTTFYDPKGW
jgi:hypothetical protein